MAIYNRINFKDWIDQKPDSYLIDGEVKELKKDESGITLKGTLLDAKTMNHLDEGILRNSIYLEDAISKINRQDKRIIEVDDKANAAFQSGVKAKQSVVTSLNAKDVSVTTNNTWEEISKAIDNMEIGEYNPGNTISPNYLTPYIELEKHKEFNRRIIPVFTNKDEVVEYDTTIPLVVGGVTISEKDIRYITAEIVNGEPFFYICFYTNENYITKTDKYKNYIINQKLGDTPKKIIFLDKYIVVQCSKHFFKLEKDTLKQMNANNLTAEGFVITKDREMIVSMNATNETRYMNNELLLGASLAAHPGAFPGDLKYSIIDNREYLYGNQSIVEDFQENIRVNKLNATNYDTVILEKENDLACGVVFRQTSYPWKPINEFKPFEISYKKNQSREGEVKIIDKKEGDYTKIHTTLKNINYFVNNNIIYKIKLKYKIKE